VVKDNVFPAPCARQAHIHSTRFAGEIDDDAMVYAEIETERAAQEGENYPSPWV
jgi:hypothetical protein